MDFNEEDYLVDDPIILQEDVSIFDAFVELDDSVQSDVFLEDSFSSVPGVPSSPAPMPIAFSTPRRPNAQVSRPAATKANRLPCDQCSNTYANQRTLDTHKRMHAMKRAALLLPTLEDLIHEGANLGEDCLNEMLKECLTDEDSQQLFSLCQKPLAETGADEWQHFINYGLIYNYGQRSPAAASRKPAPIRVRTF